MEANFFRKRREVRMALTKGQVLVQLVRTKEGRILCGIFRLSICSVIVTSSAVWMRAETILIFCGAMPLKPSIQMREWRIMSDLGISCARRSKRLLHN